jgi:hypothetical protein
VLECGVLGLQLGVKCVGGLELGGGLSELKSQLVVLVLLLLNLGRQLQTILIKLRPQKGNLGFCPLAQSQLLGLKLFFKVLVVLFSL